MLKLLAEAAKDRDPKIGELTKVRGLLVVDKPAGWTSHDVVAKVRQIIGIQKIGHVGTLDPDATGLLPLCVGQATRIIEYLRDIPKTYTVRMKLGEETDTEDATGKIVKRQPLNGLSEQQVRESVISFQGEILQVPPIYSALKKDGRRLYEYAREGKDVPREARKINLYEITDIQCSLPYAAFSVKCSSGTYVRSLCRDIGRALGVGAHLAELRRTNCIHFTEKDSYPLSDLIAMKRESVLSILVAMDLPLRDMASVAVQTDHVQRLCQGQPVTTEELVEEFESLKTGHIFRIYHENGTFIAIGEAGRLEGSKTALFPKKVFCDPSKN